jgi:uncharacterized protein YegL
MTYNDFNFDLFGDYKQPNIDSSLKLPLCLVLDNSGSMSIRTKSTRGSIVKIDELNSNVEKLINYIKNDPKASKICDLCIITFGGRVNLVTDYNLVENISPFRLVAGGNTPLGEAVGLAIDLLNKRRDHYIENGIEHYKPIMLIMSDGEPTDSYIESARRCSEKVSRKELKVYPVGIGTDFREDILQEFSPLINPKRITDMAGFVRLFELLSRSTSNPTDDSIDKWFNEDI